MPTPTGTLAIDGGNPVHDRPWPVWPVHDETEAAALQDVLQSGQWWSVGGRRVPEFEAAFAASQDAAHATCVTNGTAAIEVALRAMGVGCGDEVIVPPYTFVATATSVLAVSATPVFVDVELDSFNMNPAAAAAAITDRTRAIIPVHIGGRPADMDGILTLARARGLGVIEDAAQAHAAEWRGRKVGALGDCGTFSFQASKNLNCGEGGAVVSNDDALADSIWSIHNVGRARAGRWYEHNVLGSNFRMTEWQAAILCAQLARLPEQTARRTANAAILTERLRQIEGITLLSADERITTNAYHLFIFRYCEAEFGGHTRDEFVDALCAEGVPSAAGYVPLYREAVFAERDAAGARCRAARTIDYANADCPACEQVCADGVWLFQTQLLGSAEEMHEIAEAILKIQRAWRESAR